MDSATTNQYENIIAYLLHAEQDGHEVEKITNNHPDLTIDEAYSIQNKLLKQRLKENNTVKTGLKLGLTSKAKQEMMGVDEAIIGELHADMLAYEWEPLDCSFLIHPKIEPEIAFFLNEDIQGENITETDILQATKYVAPAFEVIDSRYKDFKFTLLDIIADNCSSKKCIVGSQLNLTKSIDLSNIGVTMSKNGKVEQTGSSAAVLGHPFKAMAWAANTLERKGGNFEKGDIVLSGAISEAIPIKSGDTIIADFNNLGSVSLSCK